jgi:hypothetical protein
VERRQQLGVTSSEEPRCNQTRQPCPANFFVNHGISLSSSFSLHRSYSPREITFRLFFSTTKVCPDSLNLLNAGDSFAGISLFFFLLSAFPDQGLDCYVLKSSRVFFVKFPKLAIFQIDELLHFIDFRRKFIKM